MRHLELSVFQKTHLSWRYLHFPNLGTYGTLSYRDAVALAGRVPAGNGLEKKSFTGNGSEVKHFSRMCEILSSNPSTTLIHMCTRAHIPRKYSSWCLGLCGDKQQNMMLLLLAWLCSLVHSRIWLLCSFSESQSQDWGSGSLGEGATSCSKQCHSRAASCLQRFLLNAKVTSGHQGWYQHSPMTRHVL